MVLQEYFDLFKEFGQKNKRWIQIYLMVAMAVSVAFAISGNVVYAAQTGDVSDTLGVLGGTFGGMIGPMIESSLASIDVASAMALSSVVSIVVQYAPQEFFDTIHMSFAKQYSFGLLELWPVRIFCFVWCVVYWLSKSNKFSNTVTVMLENVGVYLNAIVTFVIVLSQIFSNGVGVAAQGAEITSTVMNTGAIDVAMHQVAVVGAIPHALVITASVLMCFFALVYCGLAYVCVRLMMMYIDVVLIPICAMIPGSTAMVSAFKIFWIIVLSILALFAPYVFFVIYTGILVAAIIFFPKAVRAFRYFGNIYTKPFFKRMKGYRKDYPLIFPKIPKPILAKENLDDATLVMPVYLLRTLNKKFKKYQLWFLIQKPGELYLCKSVRSKKKPNYRLDLENTSENKMFIKMSARFFEVFSLRRNEDDLVKAAWRIPKNVYFVFSKEYYYRFDDIKAHTGFVDFKEYQAHVLSEKKAAKKAMREMRRMEREEAREAKRIARMEKRMGYQNAEEV